MVQHGLFKPFLSSATRRVRHGSSQVVAKVLPPARFGRRARA
jgi:hypothetical protein